MANLTTPLKSWKDTEGRQMYRLGELPLGAKFSVDPGGPVYEAVKYPKSIHTGKRQCKEVGAVKFPFFNCSRKVYIIE
jgi:hypothetical protein